MLVAAGLAAWDLLRIHGAIVAGKDRLTDMRFEDLHDGDDLVAVARSTNGRFRQAESIASHSRWLGLLKPIPVIGRQVTGVEQLATAAADLGDLAVASAERLAPKVDAANHGAGARVALLQAARTEIERLEAGLRDTDVPGDHLLPPLTSARSEFERGRRKAIDRLEQSGRQVAALEKFFAKPSRYLVMAANNAEMTAGSGMPDAGGIARIADGDVTVGNFIGLDRIWLGEHGVVPPGELLDLYWRSGVGADFRGSTATPNWPVAGRMTVEMMALSKLGPVDGVFVVDAIALREIMRATGPVVVDGKTYSVKNIVAEVLNENYVRFSTIEQRDARQAYQSKIAVEIFEALRTRSVSPGKLLTGMAKAAEGRHLLAHSTDPELQWLWHSIGADGALDADGLMISAQNFDANKLDYHLRPRASLDLRPADNGSWRAHLTVSIRNSREFADSSYVVGRTPQYHIVFLDLHLPKATYDFDVIEGEAIESGVDPPMKVVTMIYRLPVGRTTTVEFEFSLPGTQDHIVLLPSARTYPVVVRSGPRLYADSREQTIEFPKDLPPLRDRRSDVFVLVLAGGSVGFTVSAILGEPNADRRRSSRRTRRRRARAEFDVRAAAVMATIAAVCLLVTAVL